MTPEEELEALFRAWKKVDLDDGEHDVEKIRIRYRLLGALMQTIQDRSLPKTLEVIRQFLATCKAENVDPLSVLNLMVKDHNK